MKAFKVIQPNEDPKAEVGEIFYEFHGNTYGIKADDEALLGESCEAFTRNAEGKNPFIVLPTRILEEIPNPPVQ
jgi:hypothetical protein